MFRQPNHVQPNLLKTCILTTCVHRNTSLERTSIVPPISRVWPLAPNLTRDLFPDKYFSNCF